MVHQVAGNRLVRLAPKNSACGGALADVFQPTSITVSDLILRRCRVAAHNRFSQPLPFNRDRASLVDRPQHDVVVVGTPIGEGATAVIQPEPEIREASLRNIAGSRSLPLPHVPVEAARNLHRLERATPQAGRNRAGHGMDLAQPTRAHQQAGLAEQLVASLLTAGLQHALVGLHSRHHPLPLINGQRQRLLAIYILASLDRRQIDQRVPVVGSRVDHHRDILFGVEQFAEIGVLLRVIVLLGGLSDSVRVHIANSHHGAETGGVSGITLTHTAAADQGDFWFFTRFFRFIGH